MQRIIQIHVTYATKDFRSLLCLNNTLILVTLQRKRNFAVKNAPVGLPPRCNLNHHHRYIHPEGNCFPCGVCSRMFKNRIYLSSHMKMHSGTKSHACNHCGSKFRNQRYLKLYMSVQSSVKDSGVMRVIGYSNMLLHY